MRLDRVHERRGIILLVVLALLTLFAIVGITFVLYADGEAASARIAREAETQQRADVDPEKALALFLDQLIYDVHDDLAGAASGLRGHSLLRTMYGYNYNVIATGTTNAGLPIPVNTVPFSGVGRLHYTQTTPKFTEDDYKLVNYTWFQSDSFVRDPERVGTRTEDQLRKNTQPNPYVGGNASYTYPDLNSFFLAAVKADGTILTPSFHRKWLFNPNNNFNDMSNPNWTNAVGKYLTVRPRPQEHPHFPPPDDATGDVKNLIGSPGGNDSIWIDLGAPVMTAPDGTKFKMLFAPLIVDLDNRINLNTAGNIVAHPNTPNAPHVSNQGWGPWEVNLAKVLNADQTSSNPREYINLFTGKPLGPVTVRGKYTSNPNPPPAYTPTTPNKTIPAGSIAPAGLPPHFYAQVDFNGLNEAAPGTPSSRPVPPAVGATATNCFPTFAAGYLNGGTENVNHPLLYNALQTPLSGTTGIRAFRPSNMESLLRTNSLQYSVDAGSSALISDLFRLCPQHFGPNAANLKYRNLVTTLSMDFGKPGVSPYWYSQGGVNPAPYLLPGVGPAPAGSAVSFPTVTPGQPLPNISNTATRTPFNPNSEFDSAWRAYSADRFPSRINLNLTLPPYPHMGTNFSPPYHAALVTYGTPYDLSNRNIQNQFKAALNARQGLANEIYRRLVVITGVGLPANPTAPNPADPNLTARRWLAQLAVNLVDFIDEDDISTPFNFYNVTDGLPPPPYTTPNPIGATQGGDDPGMNAQNQSGNNNTGANPIYWVFGTELPKVVLNEVLAEAQNPDPTLNAAPGGPLPPVANESVKVWLELFNTMKSPVAAGMQAQDAYRVPLYMTLPGGPAGAGYSPYRITIAQTLMPNLPTAGAPLPDATSNVLGKANNLVAPFPQSTTDMDFSPANAANLKLMSGNPQPPFKDPVSGNTITANAGVDPFVPNVSSPFFLIGPLAPGAQYQDPFVAAGTNPGVPANTPVLRTNSVTYTPRWTGASTTDERTTGLTVMLRRLANPYLPFNPNPVNTTTGAIDPTYNPYVTIDYIQNVPIQSNKSERAGPLVRSDRRTPSNNLRSTAPIQSNTRRVQTSPAVAPYASRGKTQPYAALTQVPVNAGVPQAPAGSNALVGSPVINQVVNAAGTPTAIVAPAGVTHSFGMTNYPLPPSGHYDWLVHLDRQAISPMELLHVSGYQPHQLTQRFILGSDNFAPPNQANVTNLFGHYVPWLDAPPGPIANLSTPWWFDASLVGATLPQSHRLYRLFEFLECGGRAAGSSTPNSIPGKVNINTIWDPEIFRAICDANLSIGLPPDDSITDLIFKQLIASRSPNLANNTIGPVNIATSSLPASYQLDRPFLPLSTGLSAAGQLGQPGQQYPNGAGIQDTILRPNPSSNTLCLLQNPSDTSNIHPYLQTQLLTKIYNNLTTRSNVFAVWVTVGFFEVTDSSTNPPTLGAEIGRSEGRQVRHRMFALVNRASIFGYSGPLSGTPFDPRSNTGLVPYFSIID